MDRMFRSKTLDYLYRRYHIAVSRNDNSDIAMLRINVNQHSRCHSHIRFLFLVCLVLKATAFTLERLFLIPSQVQLELRIELISTK